jgi:hypothetical protein
VLTVIISLNSINQLIFVMVKTGVPFEVRTEFLNIIYTGFGLKALNASPDLVKNLKKSCKKIHDTDEHGSVIQFSMSS